MIIDGCVQVYRVTFSVNKRNQRYLFIDADEASVFAESRGGGKVEVVNVVKCGDGKFREVRTQPLQGKFNMLSDDKNSVKHYPAEKAQTYFELQWSLLHASEI